MSGIYADQAYGTEAAVDDRLQRDAGDGRAPAWLGGLRGRLLLAFAVVVSGTVLAAATAVVSGRNVGSTLATITTDKLPAVVEALGVARQAERLVALSPALAAAASEEDKAAVSSQMAATLAAFEAGLARFGAAASDAAQLASLREASNALLANLHRLDAATVRRLELGTGRAALVPTAVAAGKQLDTLLDPSSDLARSRVDAAAAAAGSPDASPGDVRVAGEELAGALAQLRAIDAVQVNATALRNALLEAAYTDDPKRLDAIAVGARFQLSQAQRAAKELPGKMAAALGEPLGTLKELALGPGGLLKVRAAELEALAEASEVIAVNHQRADELSSTVDRIVDRQRAEVAVASGTSVATLQASRLLQLGVAAASVVGSVLIVWLFVGRLVVRRLLALKDSMLAIAGGDLDAAVPVGGNDEIGRMAGALEVFRDTARSAEAARARADAERQHAAAERRQAMLDLAARFEAGIREVVDTVSGAAEEMARSASELLDLAQRVSLAAAAAAAASERAYGNVNGAAAGAQELSASIEEVARRVADSTAVAGRAVEEARHTEAVVQPLHRTAAEVGEVVHMIQDIASQTNLLALNAGIETARAGAAGKGFAVVASEVKQLAGQTAGATEQIGRQVDLIQAATTEAATAIERVVVTIGEIDAVATAIAASVEEQTSATGEIARSVSAAAQETSAVGDSVAQVADAARHTQTFADKVLGGARELADQATALRRSVDAFLDDVRAGT